MKQKDEIIQIEQQSKQIRNIRNDIIDIMNNLEV